MAPPVRRSPPKLRSTASASDCETPTVEFSDNLTATTTATIQQVTQPGTPTISAQAASTATPKRSASDTLTGSTTKKQLPNQPAQDTILLMELQKQMSALKRQLKETQGQLLESRRQCQQMESAFQEPANKVSDHNLTSFAGTQASAAIDCVPPPTHESRNLPATYTSTLPTTATTTMQTPYSFDASVATPSTQPTTSSFNIHVPPVTNNFMPPYCGNMYSSQQQQPVGNIISPYGSQMMMPRKLQDLPEFSGEPEDWPLFYTAYTQSTAAYGYTNFENNQRLQRCLKGDAKDIVRSLLIHPDNVEAIIDQLKFRFGRPEQLIQSQIRQVREMPFISENNIIKIVPFSTKVKNLAVFLKSVKGDQHIANPTLLEELISKLPMSKKLEWARVAMNIKPYPTIVHFSDWLSEVANLICTVQELGQKEQNRRVLLHATEKQRQCPICKGNHKIYDCNRFLNLNVKDRWTQVKNIRACFSCLNIGHNTRECRRHKICNRNGCQRKHNKLLHEDTPCDPPPANEGVVSEPQPNVLSCSADAHKKLLFRVLPVTLYGENCCQNIYALFDDGSSITMLDREVADKIGVRGKNSSLNIQWFGGRSAKEPVISFNLKISGVNKKSCHFLKNVYAVSNLNLPSQSLTQTNIDKVFMKSNAPVKPYTNIVPKLLIGLDHAFLGLPSGSQINDLSGPFACNTELGWVVFGPCRSIAPTQDTCLFANVCGNDDLHQMVADYFNVENMGVRAAPVVESEEIVRARQVLHETTKRIGNRFQTGLLWKNEVIELPDSYSLALSRLKGIERKMRLDENFAFAYSEIINSYIKKGYVREVPPEDISLISKRKWYLPHFAVVNPNKDNKKLRLVFDAAAKVDGTSLNDNLLKGPQCISSLPAILFNFRSRKIAVSADIREMFHQIVIQPEDRISQRFLWRYGNPNLIPKEFEMLVMIFGAACSPCSAIHVMKTNAKEHANFMPRAVQAICENHYMDDFVDSFDSIEEAISISKQVREIQANGGFELRGFTSNSNEVILVLDGASSSKIISANDNGEKVLGLYWDSKSDMFMFNLKFNRVDPAVISGQKRPTKRQVLSVIMSTFDPLGFLSHFIVGGKLVLRSIWRRDVRWDEPIPEDINSIWERWRSQLQSISNYRLPRFYCPPGKFKKVQLHIFVDASEEAFAAVAYWRFEITDGAIVVSFICSKTKCSPLKKISVPRLELQAAVLGVRIKQIVLSEHKFLPEKIILWSDSKTVLKWISSKHRIYKPYVAHRIAEILESTEENNWKWIPTSDNVADDATRSYNNIDFSASSRWINGPDFLKQHENKWPFFAAQDSPPEEEDEEELRPKVLLVVNNDYFINIERFSSYCRLKRSIAQMHRFINLCRKKREDLDRYGITSKDLELAERTLCLQVQRESFADDIKNIEKRQAVLKTSSLSNLMPYLDEDGLLRVYGRIDAASCLPYSSRRPIILPKDHYFTKLIVLHYHCQMKHQNSEATICEIRRKFWIPQIRCVLRKVVANCLICRIKNANPVAPLMGQLPIDRLEPNVEPFKYTGLDYFGPINVTNGRRTEKRWVALFTCLTLRAIHLEIAHDLSTDSCIIAMRNFMNRRGVPARIRSDNGKNFVGANEEAKRFREVFDLERVQTEMSSKGIEWIFNCPVNPSEGGIWERMVQCVKKVLRHTMKDVSPKEHILQSLLIEAENIVNSRPLTHLPISPHEEEPLTPNHFLIGRGNVVPTPSVDKPDDKLFSLKKQWRVARSLRDRFWKRWVMEYLPTLTRRVKWCQRTTPIKVGDVVFICDPNLPRSQWRRGMVTCVHPGSDEVVRRVDVKTAAGILQRAVSKLAVLDLDSGEADRSTGVGVLRND